MEEQKTVTNMGGTMRLGAYSCELRKGSRVADIYGTLQISERHRHRYEFNNDYRTQMQQAGLTISGTSPDDTLVEAIEVAGQFHVGVQFHPEFKSRPNNAGPLFVEFLKACAK